MMYIGFHTSDNLIKFNNYKLSHKFRFDAHLTQTLVKQNFISFKIKYNS